MTVVKNSIQRTAFLGLVFCAILFSGTTIQAQQKERTLEETKAEAVTRAENGMYPLIGLDPADVREAFTKINSTYNDEWATGFSAVADRYMNEAKAAEASDPTKASTLYVRAWRLYSFGRWPVPASIGKKRAYAKALEAFLAHAKLQENPLEVVHIPFEGSEIIGYLRLPKNAQGPAPREIAISRLDSRKEDLSENFGAILPFGIGFIGIDSPGTGQAPIQASETSEQMFSRVIDYLQTLQEVDKARIAVDAKSFGAYWATKLAIIEHARLKDVVAQSPLADAAFQKDFLVNKTLGNREYLFGLVPALMSIYEGANTIEDLSVIFPKMSLVKQGLIGKPTSPMLIIAGALDTQVPISDAYMILSSGDVPKEAWTNPQGGLLGRQIKVSPDPVIFWQVIIPI